MSNNRFYSKGIRLHIIGSLIFSFLFTACLEKNEDRSIVIQWKDNHAEAILIPKQLLPGSAEDSLHSQIQVQLKNTNVPVIGEYKTAADAVTFQPLIPFTRGLAYEVHYKNKLVSQFEIPIDTFSKAPTILAVYPTNDTVPENLLKIYIFFSRPMQEGKAVKNITVIKNNNDTIPSVFLDLESELWNKERTILTLWLDPGRIKRDLQPNKKSGTPLQKATSYAVVIKNDWRSADGIPLTSSFYKAFFAGTRDAVSPDPSGWLIIMPKAATNQPLTIHLGETLDYVLLKNAIRIVDDKGNIVAGDLETKAEETILSFTPAQSWKPGNYAVEIESRLEDLAGNNLNRLFDNDITMQSKKPERKVYTTIFSVK